MLPSEAFIMCCSLNRSGIPKEPMPNAPMGNLAYVRGATAFMHRDVHRGYVVRESPVRFLFPLKTFRLKPNRAAPGALIGPGTNAGSGRRAFVSILLNARMWL